MPSSLGQISLLISLSIHVMWPSPSAEPLSSTMLTQSSKSSRQWAQPANEAARKRVATSALSPSANHDSLAYTASSRLS